MCYLNHTNRLKGPPGKPIVIADFAVYGYVWYTCVSIYILLKC